MTDTRELTAQLSAISQQVSQLEVKIKQGDTNVKANVTQLEEQVRRLWEVVFEGDEAFHAQPLTDQIAQLRQDIVRIDKRWDTVIQRFNGVSLTIKILIGVGVVQGGGILGLIGIVTQALN